MAFPDWLRHRFSDTERYLIIWVITGVACGVAAVLFHEAIGLLWHAIVRTGQSFAEPWQGYLFLGLSPALGGLLTGICLWKFAPDAAGSGIPQTKVRYYRDFGFFRLREATWRFVLGTLSVGMGMSLGREGPTVHLCAAIASKIGQWFGLAKKRVQAMVPLGMGAGIAAAFNTPMAAVFFVFEELLGDFSSKSFFGIFISVVIAAVINRLWLGESPAFDIAFAGPVHTEPWMLLCIPLGILAAVFGRAFVAALLWARRMARESLLPIWARPFAGGLGVGIIGVTVLIVSEGHMGIFGIGYDDADEVLNGRLLSVSIVLMLFVGKFAATIIAYASGGSGGLFAPTLFIGAMLGGLVGIGGDAVFGLGPEVVGPMALLGMGALFASVIRCPLTSIVIIWEMTGQYALILPLIIGNALAWIISSRWQAVPLYDALLLQDKISLKRMPHYRGDQDWRNLPVSTIMTFDVVAVGAEETVGGALERIREEGNKHHGYPILSAGQLSGMTTHHELEEFARTEPDRLVGSLRSKREKLIAVTPEQSIRDVAQTLVVEDVMQVPVVSPKERGKMLGIVTLHDIARQQNAIDATIGR
ncbi:MAG: chloride channel protein [Verrucomicrobiota bacterium]